MELDDLPISTFRFNASDATSLWRYHTVMESKDLNNLIKGASGPGLITVPTINGSAPGLYSEFPLPSTAVSVTLGPFSCYSRDLSDIDTEESASLLLLPLVLITFRSDVVITLPSSLSANTNYYFFLKYKFVSSDDPLQDTEVCYLSASDFSSLPHIPAARTRGEVYREDLEPLFTLKVGSSLSSKTLVFEHLASGLNALTNGDDQVIYGAKTFASAPLIPAAATWPSNESVIPNAGQVKTLLANPPFDVNINGSLTADEIRGAVVVTIN